MYFVIGIIAISILSESKNSFTKGDILESPYQKVKTVLLLGQKNTYPTYV
jgi:hypothetical protein